jgi:hypothetical protein
MKRLFIALTAAAFCNLAFADGKKPPPPAPTPPSSKASAASSSHASAAANADVISDAQAGGGSVTVEGSRAIALGSASPSANACQGVIFFGFSYTVDHCARQEWVRVLGANPTPAQIWIACQDRFLIGAPFCPKVPDLRSLYTPG